jgi:hypothetical protein
MIIILKVLALRFGQRSHHHDASWLAETNDHNRGARSLDDAHAWVRCRANFPLAYLRC